MKTIFKLLLASGEYIWAAYLDDSKKSMIKITEWIGYDLVIVVAEYEKYGLYLNVPGRDEEFVVSGNIIVKLGEGDFRILTPETIKELDMSFVKIKSNPEEKAHIGKKVIGLAGCKGNVPILGTILEVVTDEECFFFHIQQEINGRIIECKFILLIK
jgi:hypothetical protein